MLMQTPLQEKRKEVRVECDDAIRWKHPSRPEDFKGWTIDKSPSGFGFMAKSHEAPRVGEWIHIRRFDSDRWDIHDEPFRVTRTEAVTDELTIVGCLAEGYISEGVAFSGNC